jgi:GT2 family glycosyltransferase
MAEPLVSIIIPAFNAERYIADAVHSALRQSQANLEVLVVDDGSTDNTTEAVAQIQDPRLRLILQRNQGQSVAINNGAEHARGAFIKLLDADDCLNSSHIELQLEAIGDDPSVLASCRWGYFFYDHAHPAVREEHTNRHYADSLEWIVDSLTKDEGMMGGWMWLIPRILWDKCGGYDPRLTLNNDFHFSINLLMASEGVRFAYGAIYSYRKGISGALSASAGREAMESAYLTTEMGAQLLLERKDSPCIRKICADRFQQWLFQFYPEFPDLVSKTEHHIESLGGSERELAGGRLLEYLLPLLGWKRVRKMQHFSYRYGWQAILQLKARKRRAMLG